MCVWWSHHASLKNTESGLHGNPKGDFMDQHRPDVYEEMTLII
jgi:hypothetical protein